jgi:hypothetical protein
VAVPQTDNIYLEHFPDCIKKKNLSDGILDNRNMKTAFEQAQSLMLAGTFITEW